MTTIEIIFLWSVCILLIILGNISASRGSKIDDLEVNNNLDEEKQKRA